MTRRTLLAATLATPRGALALLDVDTGQILESRRESLLARPGSALKPFTLLALIESGRLPKDPRLPCLRAVTLAGRRPDCTHPALLRPLDPVQALAYSCNSWFTRMALNLDPADLYRRLRAVFEEVEEARTPELLQLQAIGETCIRTSPLELARAYRNLATRRRLAPLLPLFDGLEAAVRYGTAQAAAIRQTSVAGKTGTGDGAWFAGFAPARDPKVVISVYLEQGRGGTDAAPLAAEILERWFARR